MSQFFVCVCVFLFCEECYGLFDRDHLDSADVLGNTVILKFLILLIEENGIFLHAFLSSLIYFISVLLYSEYKSFASLSTFIPRYFIIFDAMVNGIAHLILLFDFSLYIEMQNISLY